MSDRERPEHPPISQTGLLPVAPSLEPTLEAARVASGGYPSSAKQPRQLTGMLTRSDLVSAHARRLDENQRRQAPLARRFGRQAARA